MNLTIQPMPKWPQPSSTSRKSSPFISGGRAVSFGRTIEFLEAELKKVGAKDIVLLTMHSSQDIRVDGKLRADTRMPSHPGVILTFQKAAGWNKEAARYEYVAMRMPCDTFTDWKTNVRAIALALGALRKIDRYGVSTGAQYAGYKALAAGPVEISPEIAADFIAKAAGMGNVGGIAASIIQNPTFAELTYKTAAKALHPDKEGGSATEFARLESAMTVVREVHKQISV